MSELDIKDVHPYNGGSWYAVPNESIRAWRGLVKGLRINRAAAICSSGEVGLFALLPTVREKLVLIDHSYEALRIAMMKYLILREKGSIEAQRLLTSSTAREITKVCEDLRPFMPGKLGTARGCALVGKWGGSNKVNIELQKEWANTPKSLITTAARKTAKVQFIHGDIVDLKDEERFDLLYLSNALQHTDRTYKHPKIEAVANCVPPGKYVLVAHTIRDYYGDRRAAKSVGWEQINHHVSKQRGCNWDHVLYKTPA